MSEIQFAITREEWLQSVFNRSQSFNSVKSSKTGIKKWDEFLKSIHAEDGKVLQYLKEHSNEPEAYTYLNRFVQWMITKGMSPNSVKLFFAVAKSWITANSIMLHDVYVKKFIHFSKHVREIRYPLTPEIIRDLISYGNKEERVLFHVLLSSGMRISEVLQMRVGDIKNNVDPVEISLRGETTKTKEPRTAYISSEAWDGLQYLIENKNPHDLVFFKEYNEHSLTKVEWKFSEIRKKAGYLDKYSNGINYRVNIHAFRAFFHTQATKVLGGDIAHALIGHHQYLDQYLRIDQGERAEMYHKLEPYITVSTLTNQYI